MYTYRCKILRVVDGDTVDVDIDLGFGIWMHKERVRMMGIDTPESRTRDLVSKERLKDILPVGSKQILKTQIDKSGEDAKGKFGRILGDFLVYYPPADCEMGCTKILINEGYAVEYMGGSKEEVQAQHLINRERLLSEGKVSL